jgi:hypothetical protein
MEKNVLPVDGRAPFVCECTSDDCLKPVELTMHEYEAAHMCDNWCAVLPGHVLSDDGGRIVFRQPHFWVVELSPLPEHVITPVGANRLPQTSSAAAPGSSFGPRAR